MKKKISLDIDRLFIISFESNDFFRHKKIIEFQIEFIIDEIEVCCTKEKLNEIFTFSFHH